VGLPLRIRRKPVGLTGCGFEAQGDDPCSFELKMPGAKYTQGSAWVYAG